MGQSKRIFEEVHYLEVKSDYYKDMYPVFDNPNVRHIRTVVKGEEFKGDSLHDALLSTYLKAKKQLEKYEFDKRYNINLNK